MIFFKKEQGSITLEAALVLPIFIFFLVFLIFMIKFAITDIALGRAVSETAKQIATQAYPIHKIAVAVNDALEENEKYQEIKKDIVDNKKMIEDTLKSTLGEQFYKDYVEKPISDKAEELKNEVVSAALTPVLKIYLEDDDRYGFLDKRKAKVVSAELPDLHKSTGGNRYILITAEYKFVIPIPFLKQTYTLKKQAYERVWIGS